VSKLASLRVELIALPLCLLATAGVYYLAIAPALEGRASESELRSRLAEREKEWERLDAENTAQLQALERTRERNKQRTLALKPGSEQINRIAAITELAASCGLDVDQLAPGKSANLQLFMATPIKLTGRGAYPDCARFLSMLHDTLPDFKVRSLRLVAALRQPDELSGTPLQESALDGAGRTSALEFDLVWLAEREGSVAGAEAR
jgi:Tfp pilus assembly protein PilO